MTLTSFYEDPLPTPAKGLSHKTSPFHLPTKSSKSPGYLHFCLIWLQIRGSQNPFLNNLLKNLTELREHLCLLIFKMKNMIKNTDEEVGGWDEGWERGKSFHGLSGHANLLGLRMFTNTKTL